MPPEGVLLSQLGKKVITAFPLHSRLQTEHLVRLFWESYSYSLKRFLGIPEVLSSFSVVVWPISDQNLVSWNIGHVETNVAQLALCRCDFPFRWPFPDGSASWIGLHRDICFGATIRLSGLFCKLISFFKCGQFPTNKLHFKLYVYVDCLDSGICFAMETIHYIVRFPRKLDVLKDSIKS